MTHAFKARRLMALLAFGIGLMAFVPTAAQAELGAHWNINSASTTDALNAQLQTTLEGGHVVFLTTSGATTVQILCTAMKFVDMLMKVLGVILGKIHYEGCVTKLNGGVANPACKPHSPGAAMGLIETNLVKGLIKLHELGPGLWVDQVELKPDVMGQPFVTLVLGIENPEDNECAIGEKFDLTGKLFWKDCQEEFLIEKMRHLFVEAPLSELLFGGNEVTIDGSFNAFLVGPHQNSTWSGIAA